MRYVMCDVWCMMCDVWNLIFCKILTQWVKGRPKISHLGNFRPFKWYSKIDPRWQSYVRNILQVLLYYFNILSFMLLPFLVLYCNVKNMILSEGDGAEVAMDDPAHQHIGHYREDCQVTVHYSGHLHGLAGTPLIPAGPSTCIKERTWERNSLFVEKT